MTINPAERETSATPKHRVLFELSRLQREKWYKNKAPSRTWRVLLGLLLIVFTCFFRASNPQALRSCARSCTRSNSPSFRSFSHPATPALFYRRASSSSMHGVQSHLHGHTDTHVIVPQTRTHHTGHTGTVNALHRACCKTKLCLCRHPMLRTTARSPQRKRIAFLALKAL